MSMCPSCRTAGQSLTRTKAEGAALVPLPMLKLFHDQCEAPATCTCQHHVITTALDTGQPK